MAISRAAVFFLLILINENCRKMQGKRKKDCRENNPFIVYVIYITL